MNIFKRYSFKNNRDGYGDKISKRNGVCYDYSGAKCWYKDGEYHREGGPAIDHPEGYKEWCIEGKTHRVDGPAIMDHDGTKNGF
jgi:hypothetical protein